MGNILRARVPDELKSTLEKEASERGISLTDLIKERLGSPSQPTQESKPQFSPNCIWPNIKEWYKEEDEGEWRSREYTCPVRLERPDITAEELTSKCCSKCPIREQWKMRQMRKRRTAYRPSTPRDYWPQFESSRSFRPPEIPWSGQFG